MKYHLLGHRFYRSNVKRKLIVGSTVVILFIIVLLNFNYKNNDFLVNHPNDSKYKHIVKILFNLVYNHEHMNTHELTENLFNHEFIPFRDINNELVLDQINNHTPYDMNPNLYWAILLEQINDDSNNIVFSWYDFVENKQYNNLLRLHHIQNENIKVSCKSVNFKSIPKELLDMDQEIVENSNTSLPETLKSRGVFIKDLMSRYTSSSFLIKNKNGQYDPHQVCIDQPHKLDAIHKKAVQNLDNVGYYLSPFLQIELKSNVRPEVYGLQATSYVINNHPDPMGLIMLKFFDYKQDNFKSGLKYYELNNKPWHEKEYGNRPLMGENFDTLGVYNRYKNNISLNQEVLLTKFNKLEFEMSDKETLHPIEMSKDMFFFNIDENIERLENQETLTKSQQNYLESLKYHREIHYSQSEKHFDEPSAILQFRGKGNHYDSVFFHTHRIEQNLQMKQASIHNLLLTLENLVKGMGLVGWISHGNLLSWSYNGQNFPWDEDVDYQMPIQDLHKLAELANNTIILQDPQYGNGKYFLNVGNLIGRTHGNGKNNIDARLVDVDTGLYIDITGLSYNGEVVADRDYETLFDFFKNNEEHIEDWLVESNDYIDNTTTDIDKLDSKLYLNKLQRNMDMDKLERQEKIKRCKETIKKERTTKQSIWNQVPKTEDDFVEEDKKYYDLIHMYLYDLTYQERFYLNLKMDLVTCRNRHFSKADDLRFLKPTFFQRIPVLVPSNYYGLLTKEYRTIDKENTIHDDFLEYQKYLYLPILKTWIEKQSATSFLNLPHKIMNDDDYTNNDNCINLNDESINNLNLEHSELLLVNMCDINGHKFNHLLTISDLIEQLDQKNYRYTELKYELNEKLNDNEHFINHITKLKNSYDFHIDPYYLNLLYEDYFNENRPYEKDVCLKNVFGAIEYLEHTYNYL